MPCYRCVGSPIAGPSDDLCLACQGEVAANRADARDVIVTTFTGHGITHGNYPADVRFGGLS